MSSTPETAVPRLIVVDDTDPSIQYSPSTAFTLDTSGTLDAKGNGGPVHNGTITGTTTNSSFSYSFKGSFVRAIFSAQGVVDWNCTIDGTVTLAPLIPPISDTQLTNYIACDSGGILTEGSEEEHTLNVELSFPPGAPSNSTIWLDSIQYQPLPSDPLDAVILRIHNSDSSVQYDNTTNQWPYEPSVTSFGSNYTGSNNGGSTLTFMFNGTSVELYTLNFVNHNSSQAFYAVDGKSPVNFPLPASTQVALSDGKPTNVENWRLFNTSSLSVSQHSLRVGNSFSSSQDPQPLTINYFLIRTNPANSSAPETAPSATMSAASSTSLHKAPIGAIVGGVLGGLAVMAAAVIILFLLRRRRRIKFDYSEEALDLTEGDAMREHYGTTSGQIVAPSTSSATSSNALAPRRADGYGAEGLPSQAVQAERTDIKLHTDSGVRLSPPHPGQTVEVPPIYSPD